MKPHFTPPLTPNQFDAMADIARLDQRGTRSAVRAVIIGDLEQVKAAEQDGLSRQSLSNAIRRLKRAHRTAKLAITGAGTSGKLGSKQFEALSTIARLEQMGDRGPMIAAEYLCRRGSTVAQAAAAADISLQTARHSMNRLCDAFELAGAALDPNEPVALPAPLASYARMLVK